MFLFVCLFVCLHCLFARHAFKGQSLRTPLPYQRIIGLIRKTIFVSLNTGMFVDVHPRSILSLQRLSEPPQNDKYKENGKIGGFRFSEVTEYIEWDKIWRFTCRQ